VSFVLTDNDVSHNVMCITINCHRRLRQSPGILQGSVDREALKRCASASKIQTPMFHKMYSASLQNAIGFHKLRPHGINMLRLQTDVPEFAPMEAKAFDGTVCQQGLYTLPNCVLRAIRKREWDRLDSLITRKDTTNVGGESDTWALSCTQCGLEVPFDIMETSETKFDTETGAYTESSRSVLSKSGAKRGVENAKEEMDRIALSFGLSNRGIQEAFYLFNKFHAAGSSSGGRGHKTTVIAALHIASRNAHSEIPVAELCKAHPKQPQPKVVNRFIKQARKQNLIDLMPPDATAIVAGILAKMESKNEVVNQKARQLCEVPLTNVPPKNQAASAIFLAAKLKGGSPRKYSGVSIAKHAFVERRQIYRYAKRLQQLSGLIQVNPPDKPVSVSAADVKLLRRLRQG